MSISLLIIGKTVFLQKSSEFDFSSPGSRISSRRVPRSGADRRTIYPEVEESYNKLINLKTLKKSIIINKLPSFINNNTTIMVLLLYH